MTLQRLGVALLMVGMAVQTQTVAASTKLPVSFHRQEHSLSCEIATLKMALGAHGINVPESELIAKLPFDSTKKQPGIWGNPHRGFVGDIDGTMLGTGYGVYWDPIAAVGNQYATTNIIKHGSASELARHIAGGNPVIIWGYYGRRAALWWNTPDGQQIKAVNGQHTRIVYGFDGSVENPTHFYVIDPLSGPMAWTTDELMYNWSGLNHMGVVVKPPRQWVRVTGDSKVWELNKTAKTRHWITNWDTLENRLGFGDDIEAISQQELETYAQGEDIRE